MRAQEHSNERELFFKTYVHTTLGIVVTASTGTKGKKKRVRFNIIWLGLQIP